MSDHVPSLRRGFLWTFAGNAVFAASQWGILVILTKMGSTAAVGRFALASAIATPAMLFANMQLRSVLVADTAGDYPFRDYLSARLAMLPAALVVIALVAGLGYSSTQAATILVFGLARAVEGVSDILYGPAQKRERLDLIAISMIAKGLISLALFGGLFYLTGSLVWALVALPIGWALPLLGFDLPCCRRLLGESAALRPRWQAANLRRLIWLALPLGLVLLLIQLRHTVPRLLLESARGEDELGIFAALSYVVIVGNTVVLALSQASIARLARARAASDVRAFAATVRQLVACGVGLGAAGVAVAWSLGEPVLRLLYSAEYAKHQDLFVLVMIGGGVMYVGSLLGAPATAMRAFRVQLWIQLANALLLFGAGRLLIPGHGMLGAAWTVIAGAVWVTAAYALVVARGLRRLGAPTPLAEATS
ncbi:MAG: lipopolysaccharide biosynthesis protein [Candidatus Krumholzibacteria bacterium]|jgi:O-antigen/teichoic acid export membrane protein|nr:lipopolysaccharide biosynthesis protein [Candidatus Krumholzibacteria bacterium]